MQSQCLGGWDRRDFKASVGYMGLEVRAEREELGPSLWNFSSSLLIHSKCLFIPTKQPIGASLSQSTWPRSVKVSLASKVQLWSEAFPCSSRDCNTWIKHGQASLLPTVPYTCSHLCAPFLPALHRTPASTWSSPRTPLPSPTPSTTCSSLTRTAPMWCL